MDWLKDKKNLPIVVGIAVFAVLAAGGLVAFETGLIGGAPAPAPVPVAAAPATPPSLVPSGGPPSRHPAGLGFGRKNLGVPSATRVASATSIAPVAPKLVNPAIGPDPFGIPGGQKQLNAQTSDAGNSANGMKASLRDLIPQFNLFTIHPPPPPLLVSGPTVDAGAENYKLTGVANSEGGILAVLETSGQSQTVKPGDGLPDGGKVLSIQTSSITLRTPGGSTVSVPLTSGVGAPIQTPYGPDPNTFNQGQMMPVGMGQPEQNMGGMGQRPPDDMVPGN